MLNENKKIYFKTNSLGNLRILSYIDNFALIEKMYDTKEKYIVAVDFDITNSCWNHGIYCTSFDVAFQKFMERVYINKGIPLPQKSMENELNKTLEFLEEQLNMNKDKFEDLLTNTLQFDNNSIERYEQFRKEKNWNYDLNY